jgi:hypothetical protein
MTMISPACPTLYFFSNQQQVFHSGLYCFCQKPPVKSDGVADPVVIDFQPATVKLYTHDGGISGVVFSQMLQGAPTWTQRISSGPMAMYFHP